MMLVLRGNVLNLCSFGRVLMMFAHVSAWIRTQCEAIGPQQDFKISLSGYGTHQGSATRFLVEEKGAGQTKTCCLSSNTENTKKTKRHAVQRAENGFSIITKRFQTGISNAFERCVVSHSGDLIYLAVSRSACDICAISSSTRVRSCSSFVFACDALCECLRYNRSSSSMNTA